MLGPVSWRIVLSMYDRTERIMNVADVVALRAALDRARADPDVVAWRFWRLTDRAGRIRTACPSCGERYQQGQVRDRECRCGLVHVEHECRECRAGFVDPPYGDGCGPIPVDTEGVNERYRRRRWRGPA
jgi:hypothetical protein